MADKKPDYVSDLLHFFMRNRFPAGVERKVQGWFSDAGHREEKDSAMRRFYDDMPTLESDYSRVTLQELRIKLGLHTVPSRRTLTARRAARVAAVLLPAMLVAGGVFVANTVREHRLQSQMAIESVENDIPRVITLPDGSRVWLNSRTQLEYPAAFGRTRTVSIEGEAFFEVAGDAKRPFVVHAGEVAVTAYGTRFDVSARKDSPTTSITLLSGSVGVSFGSHDVRLKPMEKLVYRRDTREISLAAVTPGEFDWRSTRLNFNHVMLSEVFRTLETYYGVRIDALSPQSYDEPVSLRLTGEEPVGQVLKMLAEISGKFAFETDGVQITVEPNHPKK